MRNRHHVTALRSQLYHDWDVVRSFDKFACCRECRRFLGGMVDAARTIGQPTKHLKLSACDSHPSIFHRSSRWTSTYFSSFQCSQVSHQNSKGYPITFLNLCNDRCWHVVILQGHPLKPLNSTNPQLRSSRCNVCRLRPVKIGCK